MVWASGYRSLIDVRVRLEQVTVVLGENGSGNTNLYRALRLHSKGAGWAAGPHAPGGWRDAVDPMVR